MQIKLDKIIPSFLEKDKISSSEIWDKEITIPQTEYWHIVAPSGRGKTSFIHFLYGIKNDFTGNIMIDEQNIKEWLPEDWAKARSSQVSIIFQDLKLFANHTVLGNLEVKRQLLPFHDKSPIEDMTAKLGIKSKLRNKLNTCSYGEQQRIAIIRSLLQPFDVLLMDEPFSHLDEDNRQLAMQLILEECAKRNASIILADLKPIKYFPATNILSL